MDKLNSCCKDTRIQLFQLIWLGVGDTWLVEVGIVKLGFGNMIHFSGRSFGVKNAVENGRARLAMIKCERWGGLKSIFMSQE